MKIIPAVLSGLLLLPGIASEAQTRIALDEVQVTRMGITSAKVQRSDDVSLATLGARIVRANDGQISVMTPFDGAIMQVHVKTGQKVKRGDDLVTISSRELSDLKTQLNKAETEQVLAERIVEREEELVSIGLSSNAELVSARARLKTAAADAAMLKKQMSAYSSGIRTSGYELTITAKTDGEVFEIPSAVGDKVSSMDSVAILSSGAPALVEILVPLRLMNAVETGDTVTFPDGSFQSIVSIASEIDPATRSGRVYTLVPERSNLRIGQFVEVELRKSEVSGIISVPSSAVVRIEGEDFVFRQTRNGFEALPVTFLSRSGDQTLVSGALNSSDQVAKRGLSELKRLYLAESE